MTFSIILFEKKKRKAKENTNMENKKIKTDINVLILILSSFNKLWIFIIFTNDCDDVNQILNIKMPKRLWIADIKIVNMTYKKPKKLREWSSQKWQRSNVKWFSSSCLHIFFFLCKVTEYIILSSFKLLINRAILYLYDRYIVIDPISVN